VEASSSTGSKGERSPEKAKDLLLIEQEEDWKRKRTKRRDKEGRKKRGEDFERG